MAVNFELAVKLSGRRPGERLDQIEALGSRERVEQLANDPADAGRQALDSARGERLVDERAEPGVVGRLVNSRF